MSQRRLALHSGLSYKTLQLIESGRHDPKLSSLQRLTVSLGYPKNMMAHQLKKLLLLPVDSIAVISERLAESPSQWKIWIFNFVDAFRRTPREDYITTPPVETLSSQLKALLASTVEALCAELNLPTPLWCDATPPLPAPWFPSEMENLKAMALVEAPVHFRERNIFVLNNFLRRI